MAHFVEHLLFWAQKNIPKKGIHATWMNTVATAMLLPWPTEPSTFSVNNDGFSEALDRFGQFFIAPLFNPSGVDRECKAIHQEFCKDQPQDAWRMLYVKKELANKKHPFHSFCIGNLDTLAQISQDELKEWYRAHYSANLMHLVVYSSLEMPTLEKEVMTLFSQVKNQNNEPSKCQECLLMAETSPRLCAITPVQDVQLLELSWEIPHFLDRIEKSTQTNY